MSLEIEQYGNNLVEEDSQSLSSIYRQISIEFNDCFDEVLTPNLNFGLTGDALCLSFQRTRRGLHSLS